MTYKLPNIIYNKEKTLKVYLNENVTCLGLDNKTFTLIMNPYSNCLAGKYLMQIFMVDYYDTSVTNFTFSIVEPPVIEVMAKILINT